jgi:hypothetical protein
MRGLTRATALVCVSLAVSISPWAAGAEAGDAGRGRAEPFELYCSACHSLGGQGGQHGIPDLAELWTKYGTPLPRARLAAFVTSDHRLGGPRVCGESVFERLPVTRFGDLAERGNVRAALEFVESVQRAK